MIDLNPFTVKYPVAVRMQIVWSNVIVQSESEQKTSVRPPTM